MKWEVGMRKWEKRKQSYEVGSRNAEVGKLRNEFGMQEQCANFAAAFSELGSEQRSWR